MFSIACQYIKESGNEFRACSSPSGVLIPYITYKLVIGYSMTFQSSWKKVKLNLVYLHTISTCTIYHRHFKIYWNNWDIYNNLTSGIWLLLESTNWKAIGTICNRFSCGSIYTRLWRLVILMQNIVLLMHVAGIGIIKILDHVNIPQYWKLFWMCPLYNLSITLCWRN